VILHVCGGVVVFFYSILQCVNLDVKSIACITVCLLPEVGVLVLHDGNYLRDVNE